MNKQMSELVDELREQRNECLCMYRRVGWDKDDVWFAHCCCLNDAETKQWAEAGVSIAHCPSSNMRLGSGIAPVSSPNHHCCSCCCQNAAAAVAAVAAAAAAAAVHMTAAAAAAAVHMTAAAAAAVDKNDTAIQAAAAAVHAAAAALHADEVAAFCETAGLAVQTLALARQHLTHRSGLSSCILSV